MVSVPARKIRVTFKLAVTSPIDPTLRNCDQTFARDVDQEVVFQDRQNALLKSKTMVHRRAKSIRALNVPG